MNTLFPVFLKLEQLSVLLVGGGNVGLEKLSALLSNCPAARVQVVGGRLLPALCTLAAAHPRVHLEERVFQESDLDGKDLVILATDDAALHAQIKQLTAKRHLLTNVADTPALCDFYLGSVVQKGDLKIGISTNGKSPTLAKRMREFLEDVIPDDIQQTMDQLRAIRQHIKGDFQQKIRVLNELTAGLVDRRKP